MQKFSMTVFIALVAVVGWAQADLASPLNNGASTPASSENTLEAPPTWSVGQVATVQGVVHFEERHTIIPLLWCSATAPKPCARSRTYWSVILASQSADKSQFEVDERFALDAASAPDSVELAGQTIRSGQTITLQATVEYASTDYYILGDVRNVNLVMDYTTSSLPNWNCRGTLDRNTDIQADVWYAGSGGTEGDRYAIRLSVADQSQQERRIVPLASLTDAQGFTARDQIVYQGTNVDANVQLVIGGPGPFGDGSPSSEALTPSAPGHLKFSLSQAPADHDLQTQGDYQVVCGRTR